MASIFERIGGQAVIPAVVANFCRLVVDDERLAPFFTGTDLERLERRLVEFLAAALGGPEPYVGDPMREVHRSRGIKLVHFTLATGYLADALGRAGVPLHLISEVLHVIAPLADDIAADSLVSEA